MKLLSLKLSLLFVCILSFQSHACSLAALDKKAINESLEVELKSQLGWANLESVEWGKAKTEFLVPIGADCSGLYSATTRTTFEAVIEPYGRVRTRCKIKGVAAILGYSETGPAHLRIGSMKCE